MKYWFFAITIFLILFPGFAFSQAAPGEKLELVSYDSLRQTNTPQGFLRELVGNVHLRQGKSEMYCQHVKWWVDTDEVVIENNVRIYDESKVMLADVVYYYIDTQIYKAVGNVQLKDSTKKVTAKRILYFKLEDLIKADDNVVLLDFKNNLNIYGNHAEIDNSRDYALVEGKPILVKKDSTGAEEFRITSKKMELFEGGERAVVTDSVTITQNKAVAHCGLAEYFRKNDEIFLKENPVVTQGGDLLTGELIHLFIKERKLKKAIVKNNAMVTSVVDTMRKGDSRKLNKLTGQHVTMFFENEELRKAIVEMQATSYYHVYEDEEEKGLNKIIGDKITMFFQDREIVKILIESDPQLSSGIFYPLGKVPPGEGL